MKTRNPLRLVMLIGGIIFAVTVAHSAIMGG